MADAEDIIWQPLRAALAYSLHASASLSTSSEFEGPGGGGRSDEDKARFQKLIFGILFSRRFIITYNLVLVGIVLVFTSIHWGRHIARWTQRRRTKGVLNARVSNHEHVFNVASGPQDEERRPLLQTKPGERSERKGSALNVVQGWLLYQPTPIRIINKTLPPNHTSLAVLALLGINIFYIFFRVPLDIGLLFIFADRTALVFVANLPLLYLLAAKNQPLKWLTGYSYESLNIFHRRLGELLCLLALLHSAGMVGVWYTILRPEGFTLARFLLIKIISLGLGAFISYELLYFTSLGSFRQRWYELFLGLHIVLQAAALVLVFFHHHGGRPYVGIALGIFLIDRLAFRCFLKSTRTSGQLEIMEDGETIKLSTTFPLNSKGLSTRTGIRSGWTTTDHVFVSIPALSWKHNLQAHPFTIASHAPSSFDPQADLSLIIRAQDGFSAELLEHARENSFVEARLDGPYGSHSALEMLHSSNKVVLVAGGSGVAVTWPLVWSLARRSKHDIEDCEHAVTVPDQQSRILFIWTVHQASHISWIGHEALADLRSLGVDVVIPEPTAKSGRPNLERIITDWLEVSERGKASSQESESLGLVCSGPDGMNRTIQNLCSSLVRNGTDAHVEIEKYGW
ncbi:MAG: hypothetical protein M4579_003265 [Chaenotheca gracillima]|nr:MAG: hypothetical protein M4579_003265 [Chaenotheca gracillima]